MRRFLLAQGTLFLLGMIARIGMLHEGYYSSFAYDLVIAASLVSASISL